MEKRETLTEKQKFEAWVEREKENGLIDIKLYPEVTKTASTEDLYAELNDMNYARENNRFEKIYDI